MLLGDDRAELRPGEQLVGGNSPRAHLSMLFGVVGHSLGKFFSMGEEEVQIKGTRLIKHLCRHFQIGALAGIGSPFFTSSEIEKEFGGTGCLPHQIEPLLRTKVRLCLEHTDLGHVCQAFWRVASSFLSVAIAEMFGTALQGRSSARQELAETPLPLQAKLAVVPCRGGEELLRRLFEPLGYTVTAAPHMLDEQHPDWGASPYFTVILEGNCRLRDLLMHLYVLIPVLDDDKHYFIGDEEVEKLLRHGKGWLENHPEKEQVAYRYLKHKRDLAMDAIHRLVAEDNP